MLAPRITTFETMGYLKRAALCSFLALTAAGIALTPTVVSAQPEATPLLLEEDYTPEQAYDEYMRLGYTAEQSGRYVDAATYFRYALYAVPNDREATIAYWNAYGAINDSSASASGPYSQYMEAGYDATDAGNYDYALSQFEAALEQRPGDYYATQAIRNVRTYINRGTTAESPDDVPVNYSLYVGETAYDRYMRLGYAAVQRQDFRAAQSHFRSALYERSNDRQATIAYWNAIDALKDGEFGLDSSTEISYDRYMRLGYDATERRDYERALSFFQRALEERPGDGYAAQAIRNVRTYMTSFEDQ